MDKNGLTLAAVVALAGAWLLTKGLLTVAFICFVASGAGTVAASSRFDDKEEGPAA